MNALGFADGSFDKVASIDTIYWVADIDEALAAISKLIRPGGRMGIFIAHTPSIDNSTGANEPHGTWIAKSLRKLGLSCDVYDYTESFLNFWPKLKKVALELRDAIILSQQQKR